MKKLLFIFIYGFIFIYSSISNARSYDELTRAWVDLYYNNCPDDQVKSFAQIHLTNLSTINVFSCRGITLSDLKTTDQCAKAMTELFQKTGDKNKALLASCERKNPLVDILNASASSPTSEVKNNPQYYPINTACVAPKGEDYSFKFEELKKNELGSCYIIQKCTNSFIFGKYKLAPAEYKLYCKSVSPKATHAACEKVTLEDCQSEPVAYHNLAGFGAVYKIMILSDMSAKKTPQTNAGSTGR